MPAIFRKSAHFLLILLFLSGHVMAHDPSHLIDSLKLAFEKEKDDSLKYEFAKDLLEHFFEKDAHQGLTYSIEAFELAKKLNKKELFTFHRINKGLFYHHLGQYHEAMAEYEEGIKEVEFVEDPRQKADYLCTLNGNIGAAYGQQGEIEVEQAYYLEALRIAEENDFKDSQATFSNNLSKLYLDLKNFKKAEFYIYKALHIIRTGNLPDAKVLPYINLGSLFLARGNRDSASYYFEVGLKHAEVSGSLYEKGMALIKLSNELIDQKQFEKGFTYAKQALELADELGNKELLILADLAMAKVKRKEGKFKEADLCVKRAKSQLGNDNSHSELKVYEEMEKIALAQDHFKEAHEFSLRIRALKDTILAIDREKHLTSAVYRERLDELRFEGLEKDRLISEQGIRQRNIVIAFSVLALVLTLFAAIFLFQNILERRHYHKTLEQKVQQRTERLEEINDKLERANFELKRFNRIVSHDLKAPLSNIQALLELVKEELGPFGESSLNLALIGQSSKQLSRLLEDLSQFVNYEQHQLKLEKFGLDELLAEVKLALKVNVEERNVQINSSQLPIIYSYWTPLFLTFKNLFENAIKYNESEIPKIEVSYRNAGKSHVFHVKDNGIGISPDHYEKIFEIFQRISPQSKYDGSGLGLSISRKMLREIGGEVRLLYSSAEEGSIFEVKLPVQNKVRGRRVEKSKKAL